MSDFWWKRLPQNWHGYGRESVWISRCVDSVDDRLKLLPHCRHVNVRAAAAADAAPVPPLRFPLPLPVTRSRRHLDDVTSRDWTSQMLLAAL